MKLVLVIYLLVNLSFLGLIAYSLWLTGNLWVLIALILSPFLWWGAKIHIS